MRFEWDAKKAKINAKKHAVTFELAETAFGDPMAVVLPDMDHSGDECREWLLGMTVKGCG